MPPRYLQDSEFAPIKDYTWYYVESTTDPQEASDIRSRFASVYSAKVIKKSASYGQPLYEIWVRDKIEKWREREKAHRANISLEKNRTRQALVKQQIAPLRRRATTAEEMAKYSGDILYKRLEVEKGVYDPIPPKRLTLKQGMTLIPQREMTEDEKAILRAQKENMNKQIQDIHEKREEALFKAATIVGRPGYPQSRLSAESKIRQYDRAEEAAKAKRSQIGKMTISLDTNALLGIDTRRTEPIRYEDLARHKDAAKALSKHTPSQMDRMKQESAIRKPHWPNFPKKKTSK